MKKYKVAYATGSRADYGIVRRYIKKLDEDPKIDFSLLVTGSHLDTRFGMTIENIKDDRFRIDFECPIQIENTTNSGIINSMSIAIKSFGEFFETNRFDLLIVLGDRYEMMAVTIAAAMQKIPLLHLHGGEITYGNYDEFIRHSITKMSSYHFTSTEEYRNRVIQLGEPPENVFYLGALGAENCKNIELYKVKTFAKKLEKTPYFVVAFHPETLTNVNIVDQVHAVLLALEPYLSKYKFVFIGTNADTGSGIIRDTWIQFTELHKETVEYVENLNVDSYLFLIKNCVALIGNSSSGIIEAPSLGVQTINIGNRQKGRVTGESVISVSCNTEEIVSAINKAISAKKENKVFSNPYYKENVADNYYKTTLELLMRENTEIKDFYDIKFNESEIHRN